MSYTGDDAFISKLLAFREAANQGEDGIRGVLCVLRNRVIKNNSSYYDEATKVWQFSSISINSFGNENTNVNIETLAEVIRLKKKVNNGNSFIQILSKYPQKKGAALDWTLWQSLDAIVQDVLSGNARDITNGCTLYYAKSIAAPEWATNGKAIKVCEIGSQVFYREL